MMRIAAYIHPARVGPHPTGVGKHIGNMLAQLGGSAGVSLSLLAVRADWNKFIAQVPDSSLRQLPFTGIGGKRAVIEKLWSTFAQPAAERWTGVIDWIYCPMEAYLPTRRARLAATCHGMSCFEPALPYYSDYHTRVERLRWRWRLGRLFNDADALLLVVSSFLKERLIDLFNIKPDRIAVVGNGVENSYFNIGNELDAEIELDCPYVLVVGGLTVNRGGDRVLAAADLLRERQSDLLIRVVGRSEPHFASQIGQRSNVQQLGYIGADTGLPKLMHRAVAVYVPSRYDSFGIPAAEAMAAGVPVIVSNEGGLPEVVGSGGIVLPGAQAECAVGEFDRLRFNSEYRLNWIGRGFKESHRHTWNACCNRLMAALRQ